MAAGTVAIPSKRFEELAQRLVASGRYTSPSEVLEAAIEALEREECDEEAKEAWLEQALEEGFSSGIAEGDVFARVRERAGLPRDAACSHEVPLLIACESDLDDISAWSLKRFGAEQTEAYPTSSSIRSNRMTC